MTMEREQETPLSRRAFITVTTATVAGSAVAAVPLVDAALAAPDTDIHTLFHELRKAEQRVFDATLRTDELEAARNALKANPPEALRRLDTDHPSFSFLEKVDFYTYHEVNNARNFKADADALLMQGEPRRGLAFANSLLAVWNLRADAGSPIRARPEDLERATEIITAWEAWEAELSERYRELGVSEAEAVLDEMYEQTRRIRDQIKEHPANTLPALAIKARVAADWDDIEWLLEVADALEAFVTKA